MGETMMGKKILKYEFNKTDGKPAWLLLLDKLSHIKSIVSLLFLFLCFSAFTVVVSLGFETGYKWNINLLYKFIGGLRECRLFVLLNVQDVIAPIFFSSFSPTSMCTYCTLYNIYVSNIFTIIFNHFETKIS